MTIEFNILLGLTGSVASIKAQKIIERLEELTFLESDLKVKVRVIATEAAKHFLEREQALGKDTEVMDDAKEWSSWSKRGDPVLHIDLVKWADLFLIAPCDALTLSKMANGNCP